MSPNNETNSKADALAGLLDFYSDRAEAHASFLLACFFGAFTLLAIVQSVEDISLTILSVMPYGMIALVGFHCLQRFSFYAAMAEKIKDKIATYVEGEKFPNPAQIAEKAEKNKLTLQELVAAVSKRYEGILNQFKKPWVIKLAAVLIFGVPSFIVYLPTVIVLVRHLIC